MEWEVIREKYNLHNNIKKVIETIELIRKRLPSYDPSEG